MSNSPQQSEIIRKRGVTTAVFSDEGTLHLDGAEREIVHHVTFLKVLGDGQHNTVWLCDWHNEAPSFFANDPLSGVMASSRPEWNGKKLIALRVRKQGSPSWEEAITLKEVQVCPPFPAPIIFLKSRWHAQLHALFLDTVLARRTYSPEYITDLRIFLDQDTNKLSLVCEPLEGNLYHLIKARKGRTLAEGLIASIAYQLGSGIQHVHANGFFHRDLKPENMLILTLGIRNYDCVPRDGSGENPPPERDVHLRLKLGDFGLAQQTDSDGPYTEYVTTRWYRASEILLLSNRYTPAVDMWSIGAVLSELTNLRPLAPGIDQLDQLSRWISLLGDPVVGYANGGGTWHEGIALAESLGFQFPRGAPAPLSAVFDARTLPSLIDLIERTLRWDPSARLTSQAFVQHQFFEETRPQDFAYLIPDHE